MCCFHGSCRSSITPKYVGDGLCGSGGPSRSTESWLLDSLLFRWNGVIVVLAKLSLSFHVLRYSVVRTMSIVSISSTMC